MAYNETRGSADSLDPPDKLDQNGMDTGPLRSLIEDLEREVAREDLPASLRRLAAIGLERMNDLLDAVQAGNDLLIEELVAGTTKEDGSRRADGLAQVLPYWARGTQTLVDLAGIVVVDEANDPVAVTVHWERLPAKLRRQAASLASELVDAYQGRPKGGRPRGSRKDSSAKPGHPDTGTRAG
jgi:hypothetical protein